MPFFTPESRSGESTKLGVLHNTAITKRSSMSVSTFLEFLKISLKMVELEGGYFCSELNGHPLCAELLIVEMLTLQFFVRQLLFENSRANIAPPPR